MNTILALYVSTLVSLTGGSCAGIDNYSNTASWQSPKVGYTETTYSDRGDRLVYDMEGVPFPDNKHGRRILKSLNRAENNLANTDVGQKVSISCRKGDTRLDIMKYN